MRLLSSAGVAEADSIVPVVSATSPWLALCLMLSVCLLSSAGVAEADSIVPVACPTSPWLALFLMLGVPHVSAILCRCCRG
jgi:hypothetical protein